MLAIDRFPVSFSRLLGGLVVCVLLGAPAGPAAAQFVVGGWGLDDDGQATPPDSVNGASGYGNGGIAAGGRHSCATHCIGDRLFCSPDGVVCWGNDDFGQATPPDSVNGVLGIAGELSAGGDHSCALQSGTRKVVCWGSDASGESTPPDAVNGVAGSACAIAAGGQHSCAIQAGTGNVVCWGNDDSGQATPPDSVNGVAGTASEIASGAQHSCAIQAGTNKVVCWGNDDFGQAMPPDSVNGVAGAAAAIAAGGRHSCAVRWGSRNVVCWGSDDSGQSTPPDTINGVAALATSVTAGSDHSCAQPLLWTGTSIFAFCWGSDLFGQSTPPDDLGGLGWIPVISAGDDHTLAAQYDGWIIGDEFDYDGVADNFDNCSTKANPAQDDTDADGYGNLCDADYNEDGRVTIADFGAFAICFAMTGCPNQQHVEPISAANAVNVADFGYFASVFGSVPGPSGTTPARWSCP